jgi:hypothetical protein
VHALGVEAVGGLVEDEDFGVAEQGAGQGQPLAHPEREAAHPPLGDLLEAHLGERLRHPSLRQAGGGRRHP